MVSTSEVSVSADRRLHRQACPPSADDLGKIADVKYEGQQSPRLPGRRGHSRTERHRRAASLPPSRHVNVRMISQGASEINMSFMIEEEDVEEAIRSLHRASSPAPTPQSSTPPPRYKPGHSLVVVALLSFPFRHSPFVISFFVIPEGNLLLLSPLSVLLTSGDPSARIRLTGKKNQTSPASQQATN